ncbi:MAG: arginine--tRNA ligase [Gammaproteobacteria bacterium]|nr:arginine--tRNA ligase [Gammaproteobacteria bacterium]
MKIAEAIDKTVSAALEAAGAEDAPAVIRPAQRPEFGHYQANGVMGAAKKLGINPRELAERVAGALELPMAAKVEVAGPGFLNIHLADDWIASSVSGLAGDDRLGVARQTPKTVVIDYSSPNLMKEMHIGHLRSTAIGDALVRILEFRGHSVIRQNHVGDWGAQFGSLLAYLDTLDNEEVKTELSDLEAFYRVASSMFRSDEKFAARARQYVVQLQSGDEKCLALWEQFIEASIRHCQEVYEKLDITLTPEHIAAESSYNEELPRLVADLEEKGLITESDGALCVFLEEFTGKDGTPLPAIVRKSDGGYGYMATDLAAVRHRTGSLGAELALYIVGTPQTLHFQQVFAVARAAGYITDQDFRHLAFGSILKSDGKMFKSRDGADVKLIDVVDEALARAYDLVSDKNSELTEDDRRHIARVVGAGAMKYAELSKNRTTDYIFDFDTMLSFDGNTAPYLQYAYTRVKSVFRRAGIDPSSIAGDVVLTDPAETALAVKLLQFEEALDGTLEDYQPNVLCGYLFEVAGLFMSFYENCPVLKAGDDIKRSRLILCDITARTLDRGLGLLGIFTVEQM